MKIEDDKNVLKVEEDLDFLKMDDKIKNKLMGDDLNFLKIKDNLIFLKMEDEHIFWADFYAILKNSATQLLPGNLTNTTTKNILAIDPDATIKHDMCACKKDV